MNWYYVSEGERKGPVSRKELIDLFRSDLVKESDLVWNDTMTDWVELKSLRELAAVCKSEGEATTPPPLPIAPAVETASNQPAAAPPPVPQTQEQVPTADVVNPEVLPMQNQIMQYSDQNLGPGDSIERGFCHKCGEVPVKITGAGYNPGCGWITFHLILCLISWGGWIPIWFFWALGRKIWNKGKKTCMKCGVILRAYGE